MCTIGGITRGGRTHLFKNFDYPPKPTGWSLFTPFGGGIPHFALVNHGQQGVNSGLNSLGLGLQIARSKATGESMESEETRTVLNSELLSRFRAVRPAIEFATEFAVGNPRMYGGNLMLGDQDGIAVIEYLDGRSRYEETEDGYLARANHSMLGITNNTTEGSEARYDMMLGFLEGLYRDGDALRPDDIIARGKSLLRSEPILNDNTRSSFIISIGELRVDYMVGGGAWQTFRLGEGTH